MMRAKLIALTVGVFVLSFYIPKLIHFKKLPSSPRFFEVPASKGARYPNLTMDKKQKFMWWYEEDQLMLSHFTSVWSSPTAIQNPAMANWADLPDVTYYQKKYFAILPTRKGLLIRESIDGQSWADSSWQLPLSGIGEMGFAKFFELGGQLFIAWLEGGTDGNSQLVYTQFSDNKKKVLDERVCECCSFTVLSEDHKVTIAYRDRMSDEIRPITLVVIDSTQRVVKSSFKQVMWETESCPINGPKLAKVGNQYFLAWFDASQGLGENYIAKSNDGIQFENLGKFGEGLPSMGRIDLLPLEDSMLISWIATDEANQGRLMATTYHSKFSEWGSVYELAGINSGRQSGFPQLEKMGEKVLVAWTSIGRSIIIIREFGFDFFQSDSSEFLTQKEPSSTITYEQFKLVNIATGGEENLLHNKDNLVVFWASWCEPCVEEIPLMNQLHSSYPGLNVVSIVLDPSPEIPAFVKQHNINYPVFKDPSGKTEGFFGITSLPTTVFIDENFKEKWRIVGNQPEVLTQKLKANFTD